MRAVLASLLLWKCLHSGALAGAQGGVHGGCCQAEGRQGGLIVLVLDALITIIRIHVFMRMSVNFTAFVMIPITRVTTPLSIKAAAAAAPAAATQEANATAPLLSKLVVK
jgi:hypothetical protein